MYTSIKLKEESLVAYLLYMWQVEDIIRANGLDADKIDENYVSRFNLDLQQRAEVKQWYSDLAEMMRSENVAEKGHLQINRNIIILLTDLHNE
jgi:hypothetical protein